MKPERGKWCALGCCLFAMSLAAGCALPRVSVRQTFHRQSSYAAGDLHFHVYAASPFASLDSVAPILHWEFLPVVLYAIADSRDSISQVVVGAWQEYLWRFSERLAPVDKRYFVPVLGPLVRRGDSLVVTWLYPSVDAREDDLRQITPYRNSYWSVESFGPGVDAVERFQGTIRSHPQFRASYDPRSRFRPSGSFDLGLPDSAEAMRALRREVERLAGRGGKSGSLGEGGGPPMEDGK